MKIVDADNSETVRGEIISALRQAQCVQFAAVAMQGLLAAHGSKMHPTAVAREAVEYAEALADVVQERWGYGQPT